MTPTLISSARVSGVATTIVPNIVRAAHTPIFVARIFFSLYCLPAAVRGFSPENHDCD